MSGPQEGALAEEIIGREDVHNGLGTVFEGYGDFDPALNHEVESFGGLVFVENDLPFSIIRYALSGKVHQGVFHFARRT
jgi:hypothetical protein